ncbi:MULTISPECIES: hypothetical protein, partial [unclassified Anabaena]|uniref:hypothetical protein n=1 Tax=unclassified Anabaena TaxID=2619674 RepID=UPI000B1C910D
MTFTLDNPLTGDDVTFEPTLLLALEQVELYLRNFAISPKFLENMRLAFGDTFAQEAALALVPAWQNGDWLPTIELLNSSQLNGANGAFAASTNQIYISRDYLSQVVKQGEIESLVGLLLEEIGHKIDSLLNAQDSAGDEGAIFADLVRGESLTDERLAQLKAENDTGVIVVNEEVIQVEYQATRTWKTAVDGFWDVSSNWTDNQPPQTGDDVNISFASHNITTTHRTGNTSLNDVISDEALVVSGGALTVNNLAVNNTLTLSGGTLAFNGTTASEVNNLTISAGT